MGVDYIQRKQSKKLRKRLHREELETTVNFTEEEDKKKKRERPKKNKVATSCHS